MKFQHVEGETMAYELSNRLVIGVSSSALFDLQESHAVYETGLEQYRAFQKEREKVTLEPGAAFNFVRQILSFNEIFDGDAGIEVVVMSKNSPETGVRVMNSIADHGLKITRAIFTGGQVTYKFAAPLEMALFLTGNRQEAFDAVASGVPAGLVLNRSDIPDAASENVVVAFDFDAVIASDSSEIVYQRNKNLQEFKEHETKWQNTPIDAGPLRNFVSKLNEIQTREQLECAKGTGYQPRLRVALVTARDAPAHTRALRTLDGLGVRVDEAYFLGGIQKAKILNVLRPLVFFDDQLTHFEGLEDVGAIHVPFGIANKQSADT